MSYLSSYYQQTPGYGSPSFQFSAPPVPSYQPQPSWGGADYYRAHYGASDYDTGMFDWVWNRVKNFVTGGAGVGREEAKHWHRRVYGGMVDMNSLSATELGAAAGYEAYRLWDYHKSIYRQPLMDDRDREREALVGLAIAEANKLLSYVPHSHDRYGRREVSEVAAATAERIFRHYDGDSSYDAYEVGSRRRRGSYGGGSTGYISDDYEEFDDRRSRNRNRRRSGSYYNQPGYIGATPQPNYIPTATQPIGVPGVPSYGYAVQQPQYAYAAQPGVYGASPGYATMGASPNAAYAVYPQAQNVAYAYPTTTTPQAYVSTAAPGAGQLVLQSSSGHRRSRSHSHSYPSYRIG